MNRQIHVIPIQDIPDQKIYCLYHIILLDNIVRGIQVWDCQSGYCGNWT